MRYYIHTNRQTGRQTGRQAYKGDAILAAADERDRTAKLARKYVGLVGNIINSRSTLKVFRSNKWLLLTLARKATRKIEKKNKKKETHK